MSEPQKKKRFNLPSDFDSTDRDKAASLIIEKIVQRTTNNIDSEGKRFKNYSEAYSSSLEFKIANKSKNDPNLTLTGDMLNSIQVIDTGPGFITLGYNEGTPENDKATWAERSDNGPARKFLGLTDKELEQVIAEVKTDRPSTLSGLAKDGQAVKAAPAVTDRLIKNILKNLNVDTEEQ